MIAVSARTCHTTASAGRTGLGAGLTLAVACVPPAGTAGGAGVAAVARSSPPGRHLAGGLGLIAAGRGLSITLTREEARGAYQGVGEAATAAVQTHTVATAVLTPALGALGAGGWPPVGWLPVGGVFTAAVLRCPFRPGGPCGRGDRTPVAARRGGARRTGDQRKWPI